MSRVIAAITDDPAAEAVLSSARAIASLFSATVEALHVGEERATVTAAAKAARVPLRRACGVPAEAIARAAEDEDVAAVVIGAHGTPTHRRRVGSTTLALITRLNKPVVAVPLDGAEPHEIHRLLVPLNGTAPSAAALQKVIELARETELEILVAHVLQKGSLPAFNDHIQHEVRAWSEEFVARHAPVAPDANLELRVGEADEHALDICRRQGCDLVALAWSQNMGRGRAAVVRRMLAESPVPVLLMPVANGARASVS